MTREQDLLRSNNDLLLRARAAEQKLENFIPEIRDQKKAMDIASTLLAYLGTLPIDPARGVAANQILVEIEALVHTLTQRFEKVIAIPENEEQAKAMALYGYRFLKDMGIITEEQCGSIEYSQKSIIVDGVAYNIEDFHKAVEIMKGLDADSDEQEAEIRAAFMAGWMTNAAPTADEKEIEYHKGCEEVDYNAFHDLGFQIYINKLAIDQAQIAKENDDMADEIHIVLQEDVDHERFIEIEDRNGRSISIGERRTRPDGYSAIVIKNTDIARAVMSKRIDTQDEVLVDLTTDTIIRPEPAFNFDSVSMGGVGMNLITASQGLPAGTTIASGIIGPTHLNFGGIQIELKTGNIKLPDDITINEASRTIWDGIRAHILHDMQPPVLYRHGKRGGRYELLGLAEAQIAKPHRVYDELMNQRADSRLLTEGDTMTVYKAQDGGKLYIRFPDEFNDGRFGRVE